MRRYILAGLAAALLLAAAAVVTIALWSFLNMHDQAKAVYRSCIDSGRSEEFCAALQSGARPPLSASKAGHRFGGLPPAPNNELPPPGPYQGRVRLSPRLRPWPW